MVRPSGGTMWRPLVILVGIVCFVKGAEYVHLGCFIDEELAGRDLPEKDVALPTLTLADCADACRQDGLPYAGLQEGIHCFCGKNYGEHGLHPDASVGCNYTCGSVSCGGILANDIYYTVDTSAAKIAARVLVHHSDALPFTQARAQCIMSDGDLVATTDSDILNATAKAAVNNGVAPTDSVWIGLMRGLLEAPEPLQFKWTDHSVAEYNMHGEYMDFWEGVPDPNNCVQLQLVDNTWASTTCELALTFVCKQQPAAPTLAPTTTTTQAPEEDFDKTKLSLYVVLPLFLFCYGGSCILYCSSKLYKSFKRNKRQKMLLDRMDNIEEYEPDTKPTKPHGIPTRSMANSPRPLSSGKSKVHPMQYHPEQGYPGPPPTGARQGYHPSASRGPPPGPPRRRPPPPMQSRTPTVMAAAAQPAREEVTSPRSDNEGSRPATSRGVEISVRDSLTNLSHDGSSAATAPAPRAGSSRTQEDIRKAKLLENALKEARQRRRNERIARGEDPDAESRPGTSVSTTSGQKAIEDKPRKPGTGSKERSKEKKAVYGDGNDSGDSTTNLLAEADKSVSPTPSSPPRDPKTMSIQDILKMKMAMRSQQNKPKKIVTT